MNICPSVCLCTPCVPDAQRVHKRALHAQELESQIVVSYHVGAGTKLGSSEVFISSHFSSPSSHFLCYWDASLPVSTSCLFAKLVRSLFVKVG